VLIERSREIVEGWIDRVIGQRVAAIGQGIVGGLAGVCAVGLGISMLAGIWTPKAYRYAAVFGAGMIVLTCLN
jgi:hypothetical protein